MTYGMIQLPFPLRFHEMPKKELEEYRTWFHQVSSARIAELTKAVKGTPGYH